MFIFFLLSHSQFFAIVRHERIRVKIHRKIVVDSLGQYTCCGLLQQQENEDMQFYSINWLNLRLSANRIFVVEKNIKSAGTRECSRERWEKTFIDLVFFGFKVWNFFAVALKIIQFRDRVRKKMFFGIEAWNSCARIGKSKCKLN